MSSPVLLSNVFASSKKDTVSLNPKSSPSTSAIVAVDGVGVTVYLCSLGTCIN